MPDSIVISEYNGKMGEPVPTKAEADSFSGELIAPNSAELTLDFSNMSSGVVGVSPNLLAGWTNAKTVTTPVIPEGATVTFSGYAPAGKDTKVKYSWATSPKATKGTATVTNTLMLLMPNRINVLEEAMASFNSGGGFIVGKKMTDSSKYYGWLQAPNYADIYSTLYAKGFRQTDSPHGFDEFLNGNPVLKQNKDLTPDKFNDALLGDMIATKLSITASDLGITPSGLGDLLFCQCCEGSEAACPAVLSLNGLSIRQIVQLGDSLMMGWLADTTINGKAKKWHYFYPAAWYAQLDMVLQLINWSFEAPIDTVSFSNGLVLTAMWDLTNVPFLYPPNYGAAAKNIRQRNSLTGTEVAPDAYRLYQNYPNPFNPTTTIRFDLPQQAAVTLKIYDVLGQVVATLLDRQMLESGPQMTSFNASRLASGVYFYRLEAGSFTDVKKLVLMK
jgi:hypothetical protein